MVIKIDSACKNLNKVLKILTFNIMYQIDYAIRLLSTIERLINKWQVTIEQLNKCSQGWNWNFAIELTQIQILFTDHILYK